MNSLSPWCPKCGGTMEKRVLFTSWYDHCVPCDSPKKEAKPADPEPRKTGANPAIGAPYGSANSTIRGWTSMSPNPQTIPKPPPVPGNGHPSVQSVKHKTSDLLVEYLLDFFQKNGAYPAKVDMNPWDFYDLKDELQKSGSYLGSFTYDPTNGTIELKGITTVFLTHHTPDIATWPTSKKAQPAAP